MSCKPYSFSTFILSEGIFSNKEKEEILDKMHCPKNRKILRLALLLLVWNVIAFTIESTLLGGGIAFSLVHGVNIIYFVPEFIFIAVNFFSKVIFIRRTMSDIVSLKNACYAAIPTIGPLVVIVRLLKSNTLLIKSVRSYVDYRKRLLIYPFL